MIRRWRDDEAFRKKAVFILGVSVIVIISQTLRVLAAPLATTPFQQTWERPDRPVLAGEVSRTWMWGPEAFTDSMTEPYAESPGGERTVQYFDKSRMEITDPNGDASVDWYVTNGLLVVELMSGQMQTGDDTFEQREAALVNVAGDADDPTGPTYMTIGRISDADARIEETALVERLDRSGKVIEDSSLAIQGVTAAHYVPETDHTVAGPFWDFMNIDGLVYLDGQYLTDDLFPNPFYATGYPVSEAYWAKVKVGGTYKDVLMQCFERRCLTYTPDNPEGWQVEAGNVGQHYYAWRYGGEGGDPLPEPTPEPSPTPVPPIDPTPEPTPEPTPDPTAEPLPDPLVDYAYEGEIGGPPDPINNFVKLAGIDLTPDGTLVIVDQANGRVHEYTTKGVWRHGFGVEDDEYQYDRLDVEVDGNGDIWILENQREEQIGRLVKLGDTGEIVEILGGAIDPPLQAPTKFTIGSDGKFYVSDAGNGRIVVLNSDGTLDRSWNAVEADDAPPFDPVGIAVDADGNVFVASPSTYHIVKYSDAGEILKIWGESGKRLGQFSLLNGLAVDADGNAYVLDYGNDRVQVFSNDGDFMRSFGSLGDEPGQLRGPVGLTLDGQGYVYVVTESSPASMVHKFAATPNSEFVDRWNGDLHTRLDNPQGLDHTADGMLYVADWDGGGIKIYGPDSKLVDFWSEGLSGPGGVAVGQEAIYVLDTSQVKKLTLEGELLTSWNVGEGNPYNPTYGIAVDASDNVYVTQNGTYQVHKYAPNGELLVSVGELGADPGEFTSPVGVAVHGDEVYVTDYKTNRVLVFDLELNHLREWGLGTGTGGYWDIDVDTDGYLYITNQQGDGSIEKRTPTGELVVTLTPATTGVPDGALIPRGVSVCDQDQIFVASGALESVVLSFSAVAPQ